jgi:pyruvate/2-oxoacid:ferredoxin oxidoreductase alpha subunit
MARELISTGNDLAAIAAVDAGCEFFAGYNFRSFTKTRLCSNPNGR